MDVFRSVAGIALRLIGPAEVGREHANRMTATSQVIDGVTPNQLVPPEVMRRIQVSDRQDLHAASISAGAAASDVRVVDHMRHVPAATRAQPKAALSVNGPKTRHQEHPLPRPRAGLPENEVFRAVGSKKGGRNR